MSSICIHVLNVGQGDSIVLDFAPTKRKRIWGLVDCFSTKDKARTSPFEFVKKRKVASFICLTHPHEDHYKGMLEILEFFDKGRRKIKKFWHFGLDKDTLKCITSKHIRKKRPNELWQLNTFIFKKKHRPKIDFDYFSKNWYCILGSKRGKITIKALSLISEKIVEEFKRIRGKTNLKKNRLSVALVVMFGNKKIKRSILLGSDTDADSWNEILQKWKEYCNTEGINKKFDFIKVSHHGSKDGNIKELWNNFTKGNETVAVISTGCKGEMPHPDTIETILRSEVKLYSTNFWDFANIDPTRRSIKNFQERGCVTLNTLKRLIDYFEHLKQLKKKRRISSKEYKRLMHQLSCRPHYHGTCSTTFNEKGKFKVVTQSGKPPLSIC